MTTMWFAHIEVEPIEGNDVFDENDRGAFVSVVGRAADRERFTALLERELEDQFMKLVNVEELEPLEKRVGWQESEQLRYISSFVTDEETVVLGDLYIFEDDSDGR